MDTTKIIENADDSKLMQHYMDTTGRKNRINLSLLSDKARHQLAYLRNETKYHKPDPFRDDFVAEYLMEHPHFANEIGLLNARQYTALIKSRARGEASEKDADEDLDAGLGSLDSSALYIPDELIACDDAFFAQGYVEALGI